MNAYVKQLQRDVADRERLIEESKEIEAMKRKLEYGKVGLGPDHARLSQEAAAQSQPT